MSHPICIVTGANAGIGKAAAHQLAKRGATVIMACRNAQRGEAAQAEVIRESGNERVHRMSLDTSSMASVRAFVAAFERDFDGLDVLINNAGNFDIAQKSPVLTDEGFETVFATNYLGPWLLTQLLLPALQAGAPGRVINVGSKGLMAYPFLGLEFDNLDGSKKFSAQRAYYHSKLALLSYTLELAKRLDGTGVVANTVRVPAVQVALDRLPDMPAWQLWIYKLKRGGSLTPEQMAETYTALALDEEWASNSGQLVDEHQHAVSAPKHAREPEAAGELWRRSAAMVGLEHGDLEQAGREQVGREQVGRERHA